MSGKPIVWAFGRIVGIESWERLGQFAELKRYETGSRADFLERLENGEFEGAFAMFKTVDSIRVTGFFDAEVVAKLPPSLKYICQGSVGYDSNDVPACTARGIAIANAPHSNDKAVADWAIFLMLGALRRPATWYDAVRSGKWYGDHAQLGHDPEEKLLGIMGMGSIGLAIAHRARAFGMRIQYHNHHRLPAEMEEGAVFVDLDTLLATSDVINLSLALTAETRHILNSAAFAKMKKGVTVVNTGRGGLIDEHALVAALNGGTVFAAGLDVFETEPVTNEELLRDERVFVSPHIGAGTIETYLRMEKAGLDNIEAAVTGKPLIGLIPEQKGMGLTQEAS